LTVLQTEIILPRIMTLKPFQQFKCDFKGDSDNPACDVEFFYNPQPIGPQVPGLPPQFDWTPEMKADLEAIVTVTLPLTSYSTFYCCAAHAILAIAAGQHLPEAPPKIAPANAKDLDAVKRGMAIVGDMRKAKPS
jgi:hypothetical protein